MRSKNKAEDSIAVSSFWVAVNAIAVIYKNLTAGFDKISSVSVRREGALNAEPPINPWNNTISEKIRG